MDHLIWYDYETYGLDPSVNQIAQGACVITDSNFNIIDQPFNYLIKPHLDCLPNIEACLVHKISPKTATKRGIDELLFAHRLQQLFFHYPNSCIVGYNSLRFDDEFTRFLFFKNLFDPYAWHWQNGNTRWDIIDLVRMLYVYQPTALNWPIIDGAVEFKLEKLTALNDIVHDQAHDALSDVYATIALAKKIQLVAPKLYNYYFKLRHKRFVKAYFQKHLREPFLYTSGHISPQYSCTSVWLPICIHPDYADELITYDLRFDPTEIINAIQTQNYTSLCDHLYQNNEALEQQNITRWHLKSIRFNRCPAVVPMSKFDAKLSKRIGLDVQTIENNREKLKVLFTYLPELKRFLKEQAQQKTPPKNVEGGLYHYCFNNHHDAGILKKRAQISEQALLTHQSVFQAAHLNQLWVYQQARLGQPLGDAQQQDWQIYLQQKAQGELGQLSVASYQQSLGNEKLADEPDLKNDLLKHSQWLSTYAF